jgi:hypothetical protein
MSKYEAQARFHHWCDARRRQVETSRLLRSRCMMRAQRSHLTNVPIGIRLLRQAGSILLHRPLTYRIVKEI